jgi:antitoxin ParD1/3/4
MGLTSLNISLPESLKEFVEAQVRELGYSTPSEYVRELLRQDRRRREEEKLEALLLQGLQSGQAIPMTPEYRERKRRQLVERQATRKARS